MGLHSQQIHLTASNVRTMHQFAPKTTSTWCSIKSERAILRISPIQLRRTDRPERCNRVHTASNCMEARNLHEIVRLSVYSKLNRRLFVSPTRYFAPRRIRISRTNSECTRWSIHMFSMAWS